MPIYKYKCNNCSEVVTLIHSFDEQRTDCKVCDHSDTLVKLLNKPFIDKHSSDEESTAVGTLTKKYIEENRETLTQQKKEVKNKNYDKS